MVKVVVVVGIVVRVVIVDVDRDRDVDVEGDSSEGHWSPSVSLRFRGRFGGQFDRKRQTHLRKTQTRLNNKSAEDVP